MQWIVKKCIENKLKPREGKQWKGGRWKSEDLVQELCFSPSSSTNSALTPRGTGQQHAHCITWRTDLSCLFSKMNSHSDVTLIKTGFFCVSRVMSIKWVELRTSLILYEIMLFTKNILISVARNFHSFFGLHRRDDTVAYVFKNIMAWGQSHLPLQTFSTPTFGFRPWVTSGVPCRPPLSDHACR